MPATPGRLEKPKQLVRAGVPLAFRKAVVRVLGRQTWLAQRHWWAQELLRDFADGDPNGYHRFLWAHHLGYAQSYEIPLRFGADQIHATRKLLFDDLVTCLSAMDVRPDEVASVFEVGCSLGYNLRFLETEVFRRATTLEGCDIDGYAVDRGNAHLHSCRSRVRVMHSDMTELDDTLGGRMYDVTLCAGVLMYLGRNEAEQVVRSILRHTSTVAAFAGLAEPECDNAGLPESRVRARDGTFVHDLDGMVARAGGRVVRRRWEGARTVDGNTIYFVFASPGRS